VDVPVHVIASEGALLDRLVEGGFRAGLAPPRARLGPMHRLLPTLIGAFGSTQKETRAPKAERAQPVS